MTAIDTGQVKTVDVRQLWQKACGNEYETEFARWLSENLPSLGEPLHLELEPVRLQPPAGDFFDRCILAKEVGTDATVVIAGQLSPTNHVRLGQLMAYAAANDASSIIWVAPDFHPQHLKTLEWLNLWTPDHIEAYGVEVHAIRIGDSPPAHEFRPVVFADAWGKRARSVMPAAQRHYDFFQPLIVDLWNAGFTNRVRARHTTGSETFESEFPEVSYSANIEATGVSGTEAWVYLWIWAGDHAESVRIYDALQQHRVPIEREFPDIEFDFIGNRRGFRRRSAGVYLVFSDNQSEPGQQAIRKWLFDTLLKSKEVFHHPLEQVMSQLAAEDEAKANAAESENNNPSDGQAVAEDDVTEAGTLAPVEPDKEG